MLVRVFIHPSVSEGSLGTCVPREDKKGSVSQEDKKGSVLRDDRRGSVLRDDTDGLSPRAPLLCHPEPLFFVTPRRKARGLPLNHLLKPDEQLFKEIQKGNESSKEGKPYSDQPLKKG
jgi:hypothetical protein